MSALNIAPTLLTHLWVFVTVGAIAKVATTVSTLVLTDSHSLCFVAPTSPLGLVDSFAFVGVSFMFDTIYHLVAQKVPSRFAENCLSASFRIAVYSSASLGSSSGFPTIW